MKSYNAEFLEGLNAARRSGMKTATFYVKPMEKMSYSNIIDHPRVAVTVPVSQDIDDPQCEWTMLLEGMRHRMSKGDFHACLPEANAWEVSLATA